MPGTFLSTLTAAALIEYAGDVQQRGKYLEAIAAGEMKATVALLEDGASWDLDAVKLKATRAGDKYFVTGKKLFVPDADVADLLICVARTGDSFAPADSA